MLTCNFQPIQIGARYNCKKTAVIKTQTRQDKFPLLPSNFITPDCGEPAHIYAQSRFRNFSQSPSHIGLVAICETGYGLARNGSVAQRLEPAAHNRLVGGSNPSRPTISHLLIEIRCSRTRKTDFLTLKVRIN